MLLLLVLHFCGNSPFALTTAVVLNFGHLNADLFFTDKMCDIE